MTSDLPKSSQDSSRRQAWYEDIHEIAENRKASQSKEKCSAIQLTIAKTFQENLPEESSENYYFNQKTVPLRKNTTSSNPNEKPIVSFREKVETFKRK